MTELDLIEIERTQMPTIAAASIVRRLTNEVRRLRTIVFAVEEMRTAWVALTTVAVADNDVSTGVRLSGAYSATQRRLFALLDAKETG